ncbi:MAG: UDP-2,3-diacylglucosamine diphosphatase [Rikenellaceae bacterium]
MYYFASDIHLGAGSIEEQKATERAFVEWLERVSADAKVIFLCGDIFDFWYEYRLVVPRGFVRTLSKLAELTQRGIRVVFMSGNHDMWVRDYFTAECGVEIFTAPTTFELGTKRVHVAHGDNLNVKGSLSLKFMNGFFRSSLARFLFSWCIHPDLALKFGQSWSKHSRKKHIGEPPELVGRAQGFLREYAQNHYAQNHDDIYIFGHLHKACHFNDEQPQIIFMNDWSRDPHYISLSESGEAKLCRVKS